MIVTLEGRRVVEVNLFGAFGCARHALARMLAQGRGMTDHTEFARGG